MKKIAFIGEAMVELRPLSNTAYERSIAGDVYNTAVYLKRLAPEADVSFFSALGTDPLSGMMLGEMEGEGIDTSLVQRNDARTAGLYMVHTDQSGERSFSYWRSHSAARSMLEGKDIEALKNTLKDFDIVYFSGITLAILPAPHREVLLGALKEIRQSETMTVFDPNYRPKLWTSPQEAIEAFDSAFAQSSVLLPGLDDDQTLYGVSSPKVTLARLQRGSADTIVLKAGNEVFVSERKDGGFSTFAEPVTPADTVIDTTAAGDSFAAGWLAGTINGADPPTCLSIAMTLAAFVIGKPGAICKAEEFSREFRKPASLS